MSMSFGYENSSRPYLFPATLPADTTSVSGPERWMNRSQGALSIIRGEAQEVDVAEVEVPGEKCFLVVLD